MPALLMHLLLVASRGQCWACRWYDTEEVQTEGVSEGTGGAGLAGGEHADLRPYRSPHTANDGQ